MECFRYHYSVGVPVESITGSKYFVNSTFYGTGECFIDDQSGSNQIINFPCQEPKGCNTYYEYLNANNNNTEIVLYIELIYNYDDIVWAAKATALHG